MSARACIASLFNLLLVACMGASNLRAQSYFFDSYSIHQGLPQSQVTSFAQDKYGYLWIGTIGGLCRYNGSEFKTYTINDGLSNNVIWSLLIDENEDLWIGTYGGGVNRMRNGKIENNIIPELISERINCMMEDEEHNIWLGTDQGLYKFDGHSLTVIDQLKGKSCWKLVTDGMGTIWIGTFGSGLYKMDKHGMSPVVNYYVSGSEFIYALLFDSRNSLWVTSKNGLTRIGEGPLMHFAQEDGIQEGFIWSLAEDKQGRIWMGLVGGGISMLENNRIRTVARKDELGERTILGLFEDREGNVWIGTDGDGVKKLGSERFQNITSGSALAKEPVWSIEQDNDKNFYIGSYDQGLFFLDRKTDQVQQIAGTDKKAITSCYIAEDGALWAGSTNGGLMKIKDKKIVEIFDDSNKMKGKDVYQIRPDALGRLLIGTGDGLCIMEKNEFRYLTMENGLSSNIVTAAEMDDQEVLWLATFKGLNIYDGKTVRVYDDRNGLLHNEIEDLIFDKKGNLWIATYGGGVTFMNTQTNTFDYFTVDEGLIDNSTMTLLMDDHGRLWVGTNRGLGQIDVSEYYKTGEKHIKHYGLEEGFYAVECNPNARFKDIDGGLWFGTIHGVFKYDYKKDIPNLKEPTTNIGAVKLDYSEINYEEHTKEKTYELLPNSLIFNYMENHLSFEYIGISLTVPTKVKYQYKLKGLDNAWSPITSERKCTYSSIPPGEYVFQVRSANNDGIWNDTPGEICITITPPFWKTWWFFSLISMMVAAIVYTVIDSRVKALRVREEMLSDIVENRTKELIKQKEKVERQNREIQRKNKNIMGSIKYAKRIQDASFLSKSQIKELLPESFLFFKPRDIVSGDFCWFYETEGQIVIAFVDCTGHGVPGAFMSLIGNNILNDIVKNRGIIAPNEVLTLLRTSIQETFVTENTKEFGQDGMEIGYMLLDRNNLKLKFAACGRPMVIVRNNELKEYRGNKIPVGFMPSLKINITEHEIDLLPGDMIYGFTDGYQDQFGGKQELKMGRRDFYDLLQKIATGKIQAQEEYLEAYLRNWKGYNMQIDDICIVGIRI